MVLAQYQSMNDLLMPALWMLRPKAGVTVVDAQIIAEKDLVNDQGIVRLRVDHELMRWPLRESFDAGARLHLFAEHMKKALLVKEPVNKTIALHRRRMLARGYEARKLKSKVRVEA